MTHTFETHLNILLADPYFQSGGGRWTGSPWDIQWDDSPYHTRNETPLPPPVMKNTMRQILEGTPRNHPAAVYIHIPFCTLSCTYCAFFKKKAETGKQAEYVDLLIKELHTLKGKPYVEQSHIHSVFFGGGTPGVLSAEQISRIMTAIHETFPLAKEAEITMESSLSDMTEEKMDAAIAGGVNRFSFGVQSFNTDVRRGIGRPDAREIAMERLQTYANKPADMVIDLIYGLPGQTEEIIRQDVRDAAACGIAGLDLYKLQILGASPLGQAYKRMGKEQDVEELKRLFRTATEELEATGAQVLSCSHWKHRPSERSLYNTLVSGGCDIFALGMACGGHLGEINFMKPRDEHMYRSAAESAYCPMAGAKKGPAVVPLKLLSAACDKGHVNPKKLTEAADFPLDPFLTPLYEHWQEWGLVRKEQGTYVYTAPGRYWYKAMMRTVLKTAESVLHGPPDEEEIKKQRAQWGGMKNLK